VKLDLYDLSLNELTNLVKEWGEPTFRARQIWHWLYHQLVTDPAEMLNLPLALRQRLSDAGEIGRLTAVAVQRSADGETEKRLFRLADGETIETVLMGYERRNTLCISSQVGCAMGCLFCATGQMGFHRNLTAGEILAQVLTFERELRQDGGKLTNVVLMGMGEPLHNYDAVLKTVRCLTDPAGFNLGARRITISTIGLVPQIRQLAREGLQVGLAISLHAATDEERERLVPVARRWSLAELMAAGGKYTERTGRRITFEWALIEGKNDTPEQAHALGRLVSGMLCHVNLIPLNPTAAYAGDKPDPKRVERFQKILASYNIPNTVRLRRGIDIKAGCGQLRQRMNKQGAVSLLGP
jgi:23S rRNA (adenine2503-C2)-methyltransferase